MPQTLWHSSGMHSSADKYFWKADSKKYRSFQGTSIRRNDTTREVCRIVR